MTDPTKTAIVLNDIVNLNETKKILCISFKHGESVSLINGLIELEFDLKHHTNRVLVRFKAPRFVEIFRKKKESTNG